MLYRNGTTFAAEKAASDAVQDNLTSNQAIKKRNIASMYFVEKCAAHLFFIFITRYSTRTPYVQKWFQSGCHPFIVKMFA